MRVRALVPVLLFVGCAHLPGRGPEITPPEPNLDGVLRLVGRFGVGHACAYGDGQFAITAAHVVDIRPFDMDGGWPYRWSDAAGNSGTLDAEEIVIFRSTDLAFVRRADGKPFPNPYPLAKGRPSPGQRVSMLGFDNSGRKKFMAPRIKSGPILRVVADALSIDVEVQQGMSGGCALNDAGEIVGVVSWRNEFQDGVSGTVVGVWEGIHELTRFEAFRARLEVE